MPPRDRSKRRAIPRQERARASVEAILEATQRVLAEEGFAGATTNRIAERAGVNVALVYRYFAGKEAIVGALIERIAEATHDSVGTALDAHVDADLPVAIRAMLDALVHTPGVHPAVHRELVEHVDIARRRRLVLDVRARISTLFSRFLDQRAGELRPLVDREAVLFVLQHALEGATHAAAFYRPEGLHADVALDALTELVTRMLLPVYDAPPARVARPEASSIATSAPSSRRSKIGRP